MEKGSISASELAQAYKGRRALIDRSGELINDYVESSINTLMEDISKKLIQQSLFASCTLNQSQKEPGEDCAEQGEKAHMEIIEQLTPIAIVKALDLIVRACYSHINAKDFAKENIDINNVLNDFSNDGKISKTIAQAFVLFAQVLRNNDTFYAADKKGKKMLIAIANSDMSKYLKVIVEVSKNLPMDW